MWQTPLVLPFDAFLLRLHGELLAAGEISTTVLDRTQSEQLWLDALNAVTLQQNQHFLSPVKTAASLASAWVILQAYKDAAHAESDDVQVATAETAVQGDLFADASPQVQAPKQASLDAEFAYSGRDVKLFLDVADVYKKQLSTDNLVDSASLPQLLGDALIRLLEADSAKALQQRLPSLASPIRVAGFLSLTPQQQAFLLVLNRCQEASEIPPAEQFAHNSENTENLEALSIAYRAGFADGVHEWGACANWCLQLLNQSTDERKPRIGIVLPELAESRAEIVRTFDIIFFPGLMPSQVLARGRPYDIGLGSPLAEWPLVQPAMALIDLVVGGLDAPRFSQLLLSPYMGAVDKELDFRLGFDRAMRASGSHEITLDALVQLQKQQAGAGQAGAQPENKKRTADQLPLGFSDLLQKLAKIPLQDAPLATWCARFNDILKAARWPGKALDSHEHQTVQAWKELVLGLTRLGNITGSFNAAEATGLLKRSAMQRLFQPQTDELPVQLLTPQDSVGLEFTHLWVCGMDANHWPGAAMPNAWLPRPWQKALGVPKSSAQQCSADAAKLMQSWLSSGAQILFSYSMERDEQEVQVAAAIESLPDIFALLDATDAKGVSANHADWQGLLLQTVDSRASINTALQLQPLSDHMGPSIPDGQQVKGGARFFEDQAQCPFRAFANHRLRVRPLEEGSPGLDARLSGNVLHRAMQLLWQRLRTRENLAALTEADQQQTIQQVVDQAVTEVVADDMLPLLLDLERHRLCELIAYWLYNRELPRSNFEVVDTEREVELEIESMKFSLAVDRIDQLDSGEQVVIDYKTGSGNKPSAWMQERPQSPQLPLYSISQDKVDGLSFAELNRNNPSYAGIACSKNLLPGLREPTGKEIESAGASSSDENADEEQDNWAITRQLWRERIGALAVEIKSGQALVNPQKNACRYCELAGLCRIDPQRLEEVLEADSEESTEPQTSSWRQS